MKNKHIAIRGASEHNLKHVSLDIPRDKLVVITGISGSGKSSLAFDTLYAEGQRRYVESLSAYARQFLEQMQKPEVEHIEGLPPTISIEQRTGSPTPRSTVATQTEIYDYLRVLFARLGTPHCWKCGKLISQQTVQQVVDALLALPPMSRLMLLAPLARGKKGAHRDTLEKIKRAGFVRARVDRRIVELGRPQNFPRLDPKRKHEIEAVVDRLEVTPDSRSRLAESVETAFKLGNGLAVAVVDSSDTKPAVGGSSGCRRSAERIFSRLYACPTCDVALDELSPRAFSFNSPYGACPACDGLGVKMELDTDLIVPDKTLCLEKGAIDPWRLAGRHLGFYYDHLIKEFAWSFNVSLSTPFCNIPDEMQHVLFYGTDRARRGAGSVPFEGLIRDLERRFAKTTSDHVKTRILSYMSELPCPSCKGGRLKKEALAVRLGGKAINEIASMTIVELSAFFKKLQLGEEQRIIGRPLIKEIENRLRFLSDVGLGYLTLERRCSTLAGGEAQRIRLASQVGSGLVGVCYVLDEPTIGLHQRDNGRLISTLKRLRDSGNTVIVVEHDEETVLNADHVVDMGPGAGEHGGMVMAEGTLEQIKACPGSITGAFLRGDARIDVPAKRRYADEHCCIEIRGARANNLKAADVKFPLGVLCCVTGVSGSGKSTLVNEILYKALRRRLYGGHDKPGAHDQLVGGDRIEKAIVVDQSPIGRTPRSNPGTYTGAFDEVRSLFAMTKEARLRGYRPGRFSFNVKGGRCEACEGQGTKIIEMHFLPDVHVTCEECKGTRYNRETLEVRYKGKNIAEVLAMRIEECRTFFENFPKLERVLHTLQEVGLGYVALGQASTTLSGGEAQRVKLATELGRASRGDTLYVLDEPTTGLHLADIGKLLAVLNKLVDMGNTVVVIEHNMHVIKTADHIIDLGPEGGEGGGRVVATGTPEKVAASAQSYTGKYLGQYLKKECRST
ncbi:MAG: excinuclease ABC subunit UvrA [Planctomycetota bacterium]|nr:excinuclease ABC subunit UvrA [Planctomycetota bacterium]